MTDFERVQVCQRARGQARRLRAQNRDVSRRIASDEFRADRATIAETDLDTVLFFDDVMREVYATTYKKGDIIDFNSTMLAAMASEYGAEASPMKIVKEDIKPVCPHCSMPVDRLIQVKGGAFDRWMKRMS